MIESEEPKASRDEDLGGALSSVIAHIDEIRKHIERLVSIRIDRARIKFRDSIFGLALGVVLIAVVISVAVASVLRLTAGVAGGLTVALDGRAWAGDLLGGALGLSFLGACAALVQRSRRKRELRRLVAKYEGRARGNPAGGRS